MINEAIITINGNDVNIKIDPAQIFTIIEPELIDITGETDEEFNSRRNSFFNWVFGLPKTRKPSTFISGRMPMPEPLLIEVSSDNMPFFTKWISENLFAIKTDCKLKISGFLNNINLVGVFPNSICPDDGTVLLIYDRWVELS